MVLLSGVRKGMNLMEYVIAIRIGNGHLVGKEWIEADSDEEAKQKALDWLYVYQYREKVTELKIGSDHLPYFLSVINGKVNFN